MMVREIEDIIERKISLEKWNRLYNYFRQSYYGKDNNLLKMNIESENSANVDM